MVADDNEEKNTRRKREVDLEKRNQNSVSNEEEAQTRGQFTAGVVSNNQKKRKRHR